MALKIHHLNCGSMCPYGKRLINGKGGWFESAEMCCHCLLIETANGLVLVDTGLGSADIRNPAQLGGIFHAVVRPRLLMEETALHQVQALGFKPEDVRYIVPTHLDLDHAGGLSDFPHAQVHIYAPEHKAAMERPTLPEKNRYRPAHFKHGPKWQIHEVQGERWFGFDSILRQSFAAGMDAHTATAMSMTGRNRPEDVTEDERQLAKPCNFGLLYRMGDNGFYNYLRANFVPDI